MTRLLLIRHGQSEWNAARRLQGQADPPLTPLGETQAGEARDLLAGLVPAAARCSDLRRARRTADLIGLFSAVADPCWREVDVGTWSGTPIDRLRADDPQAWRDWRAGRFTPSGGEPWPVFRARIGEAVASLPPVAGDIVVVTHGGVIRTALSLLLGIAQEALAPVPPGSLTAVELGDWPRLRAYGLTARPSFEAPD